MRPEGWKNPHDPALSPSDKCFALEHNKYDAAIFEDGATAMLKGLFQMAKDSPTGTFIIDSKEIHIYEIK